MSGKEAKNEYYSPLDIKVGYNCLTTDEQRQCYTALADSVNEISVEETEGGIYKCKMVTLDNVVLTQSEIRLVIAAYKMDNPLAFWITDNFGYSNTNGYTALQLYSYESPKSLEAMEKKLMKKINAIVKSAKSNLDEFGRELYAHNRIIDTAKYAKDVKVTEDDYLAFTPYGALVNGSAVCEGYAKSFQYLLSRLGIECCTITGKGNKELHMWNAVKIDGLWYYVDCSWDDSKNYSRYDYFNITENQLTTNHTISGLYSDLTSDEICGSNGNKAANFNIFLPDCYDTSQNYYVKSCPHVTDIYDEYNEEFTNAVYEAANNGAEYFHFYIDPLYLDYNNAVDLMFNTGDYLFFRYVDNVIQMAPNYFIDKDNIFIVKKENLSVVTVKLSYY